MLLGEYVDRPDMAEYLYTQGIQTDDQIDENGKRMRFTVDGETYYYGWSTLNECWVQKDESIWAAIDDAPVADYPETIIFGVEEAEDAAYLERDVRYIERLFQTAADHGINETRALEKAHQKLGTERYVRAFGAWEDKYL